MAKGRYKRRPAFQGLRLFQVSDVRVLIGAQAHPVKAQAGHGDYFPAVVTVCNALRKTADLEKQVCATRGWRRAQLCGLCSFRLRATQGFALRQPRHRMQCRRHPRLALMAYPCS
jgi:hypothetical protein